MSLTLQDLGFSQIQALNKFWGKISYSSLNFHKSLFSVPKFSNFHISSLKLYKMLYFTSFRLCPLVYILSGLTECWRDIWLRPNHFVWKNYGHMACIYWHTWKTIIPTHLTFSSSLLNITIAHFLFLPISCSMILTLSLSLSLFVKTKVCSLTPEIPFIEIEEKVKNKEKKIQNKWMGIWGISVEIEGTKAHLEIWWRKRWKR